MHGGDLRSRRVRGRETRAQRDPRTAHNARPAHNVLTAILSGGELWPNIGGVADIIGGRVVWRGHVKHRESN